MIDIGFGTSVCLVLLASVCICAHQSTHAKHLVLTDSQKDQTKELDNDRNGTTTVSTIIYEEHTGSFEDSLGDGMKDLRGFSSDRELILPPSGVVSTNTWRKYVKHQKQEPLCNFNDFEALVEPVEETPVLKQDDTCAVTLFWVVIVVRSESGSLTVSLTNTGIMPVTVCLRRCGQFSLPENMVVKDSSANSGYYKGDRFYLSESSDRKCSGLIPGESVVLSTGGEHPANHGNNQLLFFPLLLLPLHVVTCTLFGYKI